jgi:Zn-dependent peptidase ImmA (M78 family)/DNA-binding XRE family transcriptional regulator
VSNLGDVIQTIRRAQGRSQEDLSEKIRVSQAALSRYETGQREPEPDVLTRLAAELGVTEAFLLHAGRVQGGMAFDAHMRRRQTAPATTWRRLEAQLNVLRLHCSLLFEEVSLASERRIPALDPVDVPPSEAARIVRMQWRMPIGPVKSVMSWMESAGCIVVGDDFGTNRIDGMCQWVADHPVVLYNVQAPTDRLRMTLAHELGHLVLHSEEITPQVEAEANQFAAEFLMQEEVIRPALRNLKPNRLPDLKREYGVSMQALVERAFQLELLSGSDRTRMWKMFSARGWRVKEPFSDQLRPETPRLAATIATQLGARGLRDEEIATVVGFASATRNDVFRRPGLRAV